MSARPAWILPALGLLLAAGCAPADPYFGGREPGVDTVEPNWENGNVGGQVSRTRPKRSACSWPSTR